MSQKEQSINTIKNKQRIEVRSNAIIRKGVSPKRKRKTKEGREKMYIQLLLTVPYEQSSGKGIMQDNKEITTKVREKMTNNITQIREQKVQHLTDKQRKRKGDGVKRDSRREQIKEQKARYSGRLLQHFEV